MSAENVEGAVTAKSEMIAATSEEEATAAMHVEETAAATVGMMIAMAAMVVDGAAVVGEDGRHHGQTMCAMLGSH